MRHVYSVDLHAHVYSVDLHAHVYSVDLHAHVYSVHLHAHVCSVHLHICVAHLRFALVCVWVCGCAQYAPGPEYTSNYAPAPKYAPAPEPVCLRGGWGGRGERQSFYLLHDGSVCGWHVSVCLCVSVQGRMFGASSVHGHMHARDTCLLHTHACTQRLHPRMLMPLLTSIYTKHTHSQHIHTHTKTHTHTHTGLWVYGTWQRAKLHDGTNTDLSA
jgi:hypothetical protein